MAAAISSGFFFTSVGDISLPCCMVSSLDAAAAGISFFETGVENFGCASFGRTPSGVCVSIEVPVETFLSFVNGVIGENIEYSGVAGVIGVAMAEAPWKPDLLLIGCPGVVGVLGIKVVSGLKWNYNVYQIKR